MRRTTDLERVYHLLRPIQAKRQYDDRRRYCTTKSAPDSHSHRSPCRRRKSIRKNIILLALDRQRPREPENRSLGRRVVRLAEVAICKNKRSN